MITELVLVGFAGWRLASLLVNEEGPFDVFTRFRDVVGVPRVGEITGVLPKLFSCVWCTSVWTTLLMWGAYELEATIVLVIAAMAVAIIVERYVRG